MGSIFLNKITEIQLHRHQAVIKEQLNQLGGEYSSRASRNAHKHAHAERLKCWPRGKVYERLYRRQMNPHVNFTVPAGHQDRYKHMLDCMWI